MTALRFQGEFTEERGVCVHVYVLACVRVCVCVCWGGGRVSGMFLTYETSKHVTSAKQAGDAVQRRK